MMKPVPLGQDAQLVRKHELGGMMNRDEVRMNKNLLYEIARKRGQDSPDLKQAT